MVLHGEIKFLFPDRQKGQEQELPPALCLQDFLKFVLNHSIETLDLLFQISLSMHVNSEAERTSEDGLKLDSKDRTRKGI